MGCCGTKAVFSSRDEPILVGQRNGVVVRARVTVGIDGLRAGDIGFFTGTHIPDLIAGAILVPLP